MKFILLLINLPFWYISRLIPKDKNLWIFGEWLGQTYKDNSKYLFEYAVQQRDGQRCVWLTKNSKIIDELQGKGFEVYHAYSATGIWLTLRAHTALISVDIEDINSYILAPKRLIQLWHAIPLKKVSADDKYRYKPRNTLIKKIIFGTRYNQYDYMLSTSPLVTESLITAFPNAIEFLNLGFPRSDALGRETGELKTIVYLPTHRNFGQGDALNLFESFDAEKMNDWLLKNDYRLIIKLHPFHMNDILAINVGSNIEIANAGDDVYELLAKSAMLITDFSSMYFEYLLTDRPVIFSPFDYDEYLTVDRELYYDYDEVTPGPKCMNWDEIIEALTDYAEGNDSYKEQRLILNQKFNTHKDFKSTQRVYDFLINNP